MRSVWDEAPMYRMHINLICYFIREQEDIQVATARSLGINDEITEEGMDDTGGNEALTCGVIRCPRANTVWTTAERLAQHRYKACF